MGVFSSKSKPAPKPKMKPSNSRDSRRGSSKKKKPSRIHIERKYDEEEEKKIEYFPEDDEKALYPRMHMMRIKSQNAIEWDKRIVGQKEAKHAIEFAFFLPRKFPSFFKNVSIDDEKITNEVELNRTFLFWGPPGTGKTLLASSVAKSHDAKFQKISPADILSKWVGGTEFSIKKLFEEAKNAKTIILLDEIDSYGRKRTSDERSHVRTQKTQLLTSIEDFEKTMSVDSALIACTNHVDELDPALKRRFKTHIFCGLPNHDERKELFKMFCKNVSHFLSDEDFEELARNSPLYSGSDICSLVESAKMEPAAELQRARYFLKNDQGKWLPATVDHEQREELQLKDLEHDSLAPKRPLNVDDILKALQRRNPTTSQKEYDTYLRHVKKNNCEVTKEIKKTKLEQDIDVIFKPHSIEEMDMGNLRVFKQYERYSQKVFDPRSKFMISIQATQIGLIVVMIVILFIYPMIWILFLWVLALFMLFNQVLLPISVFTWQQFIKNDESNEIIQNNMISQILGLLVFVFFVANGTTFFDYSYKVIDVCIEWLFSYLAIVHLSVVVNFLGLYWTHEKPSFSTHVYKVKRKLSDMLITTRPATDYVVPHTQKKLL
eukprot:336194_1